MRIMDADKMTVEQFCCLVCQGGIELKSFNGYEVVHAWKDGFSVRTAAKCVIGDMLGIRVYW